MRTRFIAAMVLIGALIALCVMPIDAQPLEDEDRPPSVELGHWASDLNVGPKMDAAGRDLRGSVFIRQDLRGAMFTGADLSETEFVNCDLSGASFKGAIFSDSSLEVCTLDGADFDDATINGRNADAKGLRTCSVGLSEKQLKSTRSYRTKNLNGCTIAGSKWYSEESRVKYDFRGAELVGVCLVEGDFSDCDFTDARIDRIEIVGAQVTFQQLASTWNYKVRVLGEKNPRFPKLRLYNGVPFALPGGRPPIEGKVNFRGANLTGLRICGSPLPDADFTDATISDASFVRGITKAQLGVTRNYKEGHLSRLEFWHLDLSDLDLSRQNLAGTRFEECFLRGADFRDSVISESVFSGAAGLTVEQIKSTWNYKNGRMAGVVLPKDIAEALQKEREAKKEAKK